MLQETNFHPDGQIVELGLPQLPVTVRAEYISMLEESWNQIIRKHKGIFLFDCADVAREVAWMVGGEWDEFNGVRVDQPDVAAINFAANQVLSEYCRSGNYCYLND